MSHDDDEWLGQHLVTTQSVLKGLERFIAGQFKTIIVNLRIKSSR